MTEQLSFDLYKPAIKGTPLLRWPGGKRVLLKHLLPLLPLTYNSYYEPFLGGGALFFALQPKTAVLSDSNFDLINCYTQVRDRPEEVIVSLSALRNTVEDYYSIRDKVPTEEVDKAARFIYLLRLSFNGIHRLNLEGKFNVPYSHRTHLQPCDPEKIREASKALALTELRCEDFEATLANATEGDLVYIDPPYTVTHGNNGFLQYNARIFSWDDQGRLANLARELARRGCKVIVSNADHSSILSLYSDFKLKRVERRSIIAASGKNRRQITECIFYNEV